jgi:hypothetical protein
MRICPTDFDRGSTASTATSCPASAGQLQAPTLGVLLGNGKGRIFCSTEEVEATPEIYESARVSTRIVPTGGSTHEVFLDYTTERVASDTLRSRLAAGAPLSIVAQVAGIDDDGALHCDPLVIGFPWLSDGSDPPVLAEGDPSSTNSSAAGLAALNGGRHVRRTQPNLRTTKPCWRAGFVKRLNGFGPSPSAWQASYWKAMPDS